MADRALVGDILYAHGFDFAAREVEAGRRSPAWAAWHVERRLDVYASRARRCLDALAPHFARAEGTTNG